MISSRYNNILLVLLVEYNGCVKGHCSSFKRYNIPRKYGVYLWAFMYFRVIKKYLIMRNK